MPVKKKVLIDPGDFTVDEMDSLAREGIDLQEHPTAAIVLLYLRRTKPDATLAEAGAMKFKEFEIGERDPT